MQHAAKNWHFPRFRFFLLGFFFLSGDCAFLDLFFVSVCRVEEDEKDDEDDDGGIFLE